MTFVRRYLSLVLKRHFLSKQRKLKWHVTQWFMPLLLLFWANGVSGYRALPCPGEKQAAERSLRRIENEWPIRGSGDPVTQYIQSLGVRLAHLTAEGRRIFWRFYVVRNLAPNAFSIGNGYVFVTEGVVNLARNESELAAILAHELGHELAGHFCAESRSNSSGSWLDIFTTPSSRQYEAGIGSMIQVIDPVKELQADRIALSILRSGGFDPLAMLDITRRLPPENTGHFTDEIRIRSLEQATANMPRMFVETSEYFVKTKRILAAESVH